MAVFTHALRIRPFWGRYDGYWDDFWVTSPVMC